MSVRPPAVVLAVVLAAGCVLEGVLDAASMERGADRHVETVEAVIRARVDGR